jgi:hypothetical protein
VSDWSAGYVSELGYTYGYYEELNTNRIDLCLLNKGFRPPTITHALELGFGQGVSVNIHAAASEVTWTGTDFNPSQANFARQLAGQSGAKATLHDASFQEFLANDDTPEFQFIGLHGIWSWVSDANRQAIVDIIRAKLAVGGVVYTSYNTLPGWAGFAPMRHLMTQHAKVLGSTGEGIINRIDDAFEFSSRLFGLNPRYLLANPQAAERMKKMKEQNRHYLAHEFFNEDWHPMHFSAINELLAEAKLEFAASATFSDHVDDIHFTPEQRQFLSDIPDATLRETAKDFILNQQFRKDYWIKGPVRLAPLERVIALRGVKIVLTIPASEITLKTTGALGEVSFSESVYQPIIDFLSDHRVRTIGEVENHFAKSGSDSGPRITLAQITQAIILLLDTGQVALTQDDTVKSAVKTQSAALNEVLLDKAKYSNDVAYLASPITGGGVTANRFEMLFLLAIAEGAAEPESWAESAWRVLASQGHRLINQGVTLESDQENLTELTSKAKEFEQKRLITFRTLGII